MAGYFNKKLITSAFISLVLISILPKPVFAAVPVFETNPKLVGTQTLQQTITAITTGKILTQDFWEWAFKAAAEALKRQLLNMIVDQIVNWIQGGGSPKFITDWPGFFRDAVDQAGGRFLQQLGLGQLCSAFRLKLSLAFIPIASFSDRSSCTLSKVGANLDEFLKDFKTGGWIAWQEMVLRPQNNIYGAYLMAWDQYEIEKSAAAKAATAEAQAGKGFLSVRKCLEIVSQPDGVGGFETRCIKETIVTPGAVVGDLAAKAVGSDIDYIVNADDFAAYVGAITNAILNRMFSEGLGLLRTAFSDNGTGGGGGSGNVSSAQAQCAQLLGKPAYNDCISSAQRGVDIKEFQKNYLISLINQDLIYQNQLLGAKQATLIVLNQSVDTLNQLSLCQGSMPFTLSQVKGDVTSIANQIAQIQSDIIALQTKQQEIKSVIDQNRIVSLYIQIADLVNPGITQSLALAAQEETNQKQQFWSTYQQQLNSCQQQQQQQDMGR